MFELVLVIWSNLNNTCFFIYEILPLHVLSNEEVAILLKAFPNELFRERLLQTGVKSFANHVQFQQRLVVSENKVLDNDGVFK